MKIEMGANGLPTTFVPGRNLMFLTAAAALGYRRGISDLVGGMCETDYSGYPDCRDATIKAVEQRDRSRHGREIQDPHAADVSRQGRRPGRWPNSSAVRALVDLIVEETVTCYRRRPYASPRLGLRLRRLSGLRSAREGYAKYRERAMTLFGQGNLLHAARRGRADRPRRGVPALCRLQSVDRAGARPRQAPSASSATPISSAPTARAAASSRTPEALAHAVAAQWPRTRAASPMSSAPAASRCCSSMTPLIDALHARGFEIGVETNGTLEPPPGIDWICVSPKANAELVLKRGDELKLVYPQEGADAGALCRSCVRSFLPAADGRSRSARPTRAPRPTIAWPIRNGG